jgi:hypothetical protein
LLRHSDSPRRSEAKTGATANASRLSPLLSCKTHCRKLPFGVISLRPEKPKRPEPKFNQNHFAQLRLLSLTKNSCKLAVKAEIDYTLKL